MEEVNLVENRTFRYPVLYRVVALFSVLLFGFIVLGSVIAEVEAIRNDRADAVLHVVGFVSGIAADPLGPGFRHALDYHGSRWPACALVTAPVGGAVARRAGLALSCR